MKKSLILVAVAAIAFAACQKVESTIEDTPIAIKNDNGTVTLKASMPAFVDADTKAAVNSDGVFSWTVNDDVIDVRYVKDGSSDVWIKFKCTNASTGEFTSIDEIPSGYALASSGTVAYYPSGYRGTGSDDSPLLITSSDSGKDFTMHATLDAGSLAFEHDNAMLKLSVNNVPSFATLITITDGTKEIAALELDSETTVSNILLPTLVGQVGKLHIQIEAESEEEGNVVIFEKSTKNDSNVNIQAGHIYTLPILTIPVSVYVSKYTGWNSTYAYIYYDNGNQEAAWPGTEITGELQAIAISDVNLEQTAHIIMNAGDNNTAKAFTRVETEGFTASSAKKVTVSTVNQDNMVLYFRDDGYQNENWGEYYIYAWDSSDNKFFGDWPGKGKSDSIFSWNEYPHYGQSNNWIASYTFTGKPAINVILNNYSDKQTSDTALESGKDNWIVVSNDTSGNAQYESFPTVSVSVQ